MIHLEAVLSKEPNVTGSKFCRVQLKKKSNWPTRRYVISSTVK